MHRFTYVSSMRNWSVDRNERQNGDGAKDSGEERKEICPLPWLFQSNTMWCHDMKVIDSESLGITFLVS
jgi:hypothetical protein